MFMEDVAALAPAIQELFNEDCSVYIADKEKTLAAINHPKIDLGVKVGTPMSELKQTLSYRVLTEGKRLSAQVPRDKSMFGIPYAAVGVPLWDNGALVGGITVVSSLDNHQQLADMAHKMNLSVEAVSIGSSGFAASAEELAATSAELATNTQKITDDVKDMDEIIGLIMEIASQTHLLGLNAAIEAARAGEMGRGFNVVAEEIRKLAARTQSSAKEVTTKLGRIKNNIQSLNEHVLQVSAVSQEQAATSEEITSSIEDLSPIAKDLITASEKLLV